MTKTAGRWVAVAVLACAMTTWAQTAPKVAPYPMQFPRPLSAAESEELDSEFRDFLRAAGAKVSVGAELKKAFGDLRRQDCDVDDGCLGAFALFADSLYGLFVSVDVGLKQTVVTGRIVDSYGKEFSRVKALSAPTGKSRLATAKELLKQLVAGLRVSELPVTRAPVTVAPPVTVDAGVPAPPAPSPDAGVVLTPPPPPPVERGPAAGTIAGYSMLGVGGAATIGGLALFLTGNSAARGEATPDGVLTPTGDRDRLRAAGTQQTIGVTLLAAGAAAAVGGLVFLVMTPAEAPAKPISMWMTPMPGGAAIGVNGALP